MMEMDMQEFASTRSRIFHPAHKTRRAPSSLGNLVAGPLRWARRALAQHRDERLLQALSDAQLRDLGITRGEIQRTVRDGLNR